MERAQKHQLLEMHQPGWTGTFIWLGFLATFCLIEGLLLLTLSRGPFWLAVPLVLLQAHVMHFHLIAFHEAAHGNLCPDRRCNDVFGLFVGVLGLMSLTLYRTVHHTHHAYLSRRRDEEMWPFVIPGTPRWVRRLAAFCELVFGLVYTPLLFLRAFLRKGSPVRNPLLRRRVWGELLAQFGLWGGIVSATAYWDAWGYFLVLYLLPAALAGMMQSVRKYIEHMGLLGSTVMESTRSIVAPGLVGRLVALSLFNEPYHGVHHIYARLPQEKLPEFGSVLTHTRSPEVPLYPSYRQAFWEMLKSLRDPRVGAQWREAFGEEKSGQPLDLAQVEGSPQVWSPSQERW